MPEIILVDTDILIETGRNVSEAIACLAQIEQRATLGISVISEMELVVGLRNKNEMRVLDTFLARFQIVPLNDQISETAVSLLRRYRLSHGLLIPDCLIAATAIAMDYRFVTRNVRDYRFMQNLKLLPYPNPFSIQS